MDWHDSWPSATSINLTGVGKEREWAVPEGGGGRHAKESNVSLVFSLLGPLYVEGAQFQLIGTVFPEELTILLSRCHNWNSRLWGSQFLVNWSHSHLPPVFRCHLGHTQLLVPFLFNSSLFSMLLSYSLCLSPFLLLLAGVPPLPMFPYLSFAFPVLYLFSF